jgi:branched-subunit amino acid transport protein
MSTGWIVTLGLGTATALIKAVGPVFVGSRRLPPAVLTVLQLLAPALLAALVATQVFATGRDLTIDARAAGLLAAVTALFIRAPALMVVGFAAAGAALVRLLAA